MRKTNVGGQAVLEGVMMRGVKGLAVAVRKPDGEISVEYKDIVPFTQKNKFFALPVIRGFVSLIDSLREGIKALNYSAEFFEDDEEEPSKFEKWLQNKLGDKFDNTITTITMIVSFLVAIALFVGMPTIAANFLKKVITNTILLNIIEGIIRVVILISYIAVIAKMDDINRVYQYHGAEHKTIFCYENEEELTPENVKKFSRFHPRCGTNFLFLVMIVSIIIFAFTGWGTFVERIAFRICLIPVVSGVTYEIIKWVGKSSSAISKIVAYPGLQLQKLTTREPDESQIEVAIAALKAAEGIDNEDKTTD
ncbi:DUF1385 domain-containing protein [Inconstantimicrobium porci]|uniref:DUF1385 domain-containing protein n=1 Tax=Inconstantimicrobium porci TaxID=2652291 RepID=UPI001F284192|nr:DUF1385 domain-containing protein [Inconstantimicrobium porci]MDD6770795.1 DUF1385 domain-containing protein [Inconstantimicrobium porci]